MKPKILVLGIGNELCGDDGFGPTVAREFSRLKTDGVDIRNGDTRGLNLIWCMEDYDIVLVADVVKGIGEPGQIEKIEWRDITEEGMLFSLHELGLTQATTLAKAMNVAIPKIVIFGVQPKKMKFGDTELSPEVSEAVPIVVEMIQKEICSLR